MSVADMGIVGVMMTVAANPIGVGINVKRYEPVMGLCIIIVWYVKVMVNVSMWIHVSVALDGSLQQNLKIVRFSHAMDIRKEYLVLLTLVAIIMEHVSDPINVLVLKDIRECGVNRL